MHCSTINNLADFVANQFLLVRYFVDEIKCDVSDADLLRLLHLTHSEL